MNKIELLNKPIVKHKMGNFYKCKEAGFLILSQTDSGRYNLIRLEDGNRLDHQRADINDFMNQFPNLVLITDPIVITPQIS
ncbi:MAG: hypothetical protein ACJAY9_000751 [Flavobacteriales bacterium]|jgi:hypothetical protein